MQLNDTKTFGAAENVSPKLVVPLVVTALFAKVIENEPLATLDVARAPMFAGVTVCHVLSFLRKTLFDAVCVVGTWLPWDAAAAPMFAAVRLTVPFL